MAKKRNRRTRMNLNRTVGNAINRLANMVNESQPASIEEACDTSFFVDLQTVLGVNLEGGYTQNLGNLITLAVVKWSDAMVGLLSEVAISQGLTPLHDLQFPPTIPSENPKEFVESTFYLGHGQRRAAFHVYVASDDFRASLTVWVAKSEDDPDDTPDAHVEVTDPTAIDERLIQPMFAYLRDGTLPS